MMNIIIVLGYSALAALNIKGAIEGYWISWVAIIFILSCMAWVLWMNNSK